MAHNLSGQKKEKLNLKNVLNNYQFHLKFMLTFSIVKK